MPIFHRLGIYKFKSKSKRIRMTKFVKLSIAALALVGMSATAGTLEDTKKQGFVKCGYRWWTTRLF